VRFLQPVSFLGGVSPERRDITRPTAASDERFARKSTPERARRAGHGVAVLLKIYAHCIAGQATAANQRIAEDLGTQDAEEDPGDEDNGDVEQAS
jgi:hypothetical protein